MKFNFNGIILPKSTAASRQILLVMKLVTLLLLTTFIQVSGHVKAQSITYSKHDASLKELFQVIRKQTGYEFLYNDQMIKKANKLSLSFDHTPLKEALDQIFEREPLSYTILGKTIIVKEKVESVNSFLEQLVLIKVQGTIRDSASNNPLAGVTIQVRGSTIGTTTDTNGEFTLEIRGDAVLEIKYLGYTGKVISVNGRSEINIILRPSTTGLTQVMVVGYGTQKKIDVTGALSSISGKALTESPAVNLSNDLVGRLPGLVATNSDGSPGAGSDYTIRGLGTLNNNSPLIVVDGVVRNDFSQFDPNEIASITILKDASAAVYGARAANGVILVTTKHGTIGKPLITYTANIGVQQPTQYPKLMNGYQYATIRNQALTNEGYDPANPAQAGMFFSQQDLADLKSGKTGVNWYDATFRKNPLITHHNLSLSGGSEAIQYFASAGYVNQDGMYDNINFKRYNFRTNLDASISKNFKVTLELDGRQENYESSGFTAPAIFADVVRADPALPRAFWPDGKPYNTNGEHPWAMAHAAGYEATTNNIFHGTLSATWDLPFITRGLTLSGTASWGREFDFLKDFLVPYTMYDEDPQGNVTGTKVVGPGGGQTSLSETFNQDHSSLYNISFNYDRSFGKHNIKGLILYEQSQAAGDNFNGVKADFISNVKDELFASGSENQTITGYGFLSDARQSIVGRANYNYNNKYLFEASFRYDGSFIFPKGHRFGFFPSISAGWNIAEEPFFKNSSALSFINILKLRASKGLLGNDRVSSFQYEDSYTIQSGTGPVFAGNPVSSLSYGVFPNPDITWERADINDIGLEATLWNGLLGFEFDYFVKHTSDILWSQVRSVPATFGRSLPNANYAAMDDKGYEIQLTHENNIGKVHYNIGAQVSFSANKVVRIDDPPNAPDYAKQLGKPVGFIVGYKALGIFQSDAEAQKWLNGKEFGIAAKGGDIKYADKNGDGVINSNDQIVLSDYNNIPRIIFGVTLGAEWHNFYLSALIQGGAENNLLLTGAGRVMFQTGGNNNNFVYLLNSWSPDNKNAPYPLAWIDSRSINNQNSSIWLKKDSYARLKSLQLGYSFKPEWLRSKGIDELKVYVSGFNLLTLSQVPMFDPEADNNNYTGSGAYYPQQRIINTGISLTF